LITGRNSAPVELSVTAYPNPYTDRVLFTINSSQSGPAVLEVFSTAGQKLQTVYQGNIYAGIKHTAEYQVPVKNRVNMIYILRIGNKHVSGKLLRPN
jgi:hypothetical protein